MTVTINLTSDEYKKIINKASKQINNCCADNCIFKKPIDKQFHLVNVFKKMILKTLNKNIRQYATVTDFTLIKKNRLKYHNNSRDKCIRR